MTAHRDQALFWFWHTAVLGLVGLSAVLGWTDVLLHSGREHAVAVMAALYLIGVALSVARMREFRRYGDNIDPAYAAHRLAGIALVGKLLVLVGLLGTVGGMILGLEGITADSVADAGAAGGRRQ